MKPRALKRPRKPRMHAATMAGLIEPAALKNAPRGFNAFPQARAMIKRDALAQNIIAFWADVIAMDVDPAKAKWADKLKASELAARYVGLLDAEEKGTVFNTINVIDARGASEKDLLERLHAIERARAALPVVDTHDVVAEGTLRDEPPHDAPPSGEGSN